VDGDVFVPMAVLIAADGESANDVEGGLEGYQSDPWWCPSLSRQDSFMFSLVV